LITITVQSREDGEVYYYRIDKEEILRCWKSSFADKHQDKLLYDASKWFTEHLMLSLFDYKKDA
jgi:hypothetical protein